MPVKKDYRKKKIPKKNQMTLLKRVKALEASQSVEEVKRRYTPFNEVSIQLQSSNLPVWTLINSLQQGDGSNAINGTSYINRGISYKFLLHNTSSEPGIVRMAILRLKSGQTLDQTGEDLFTGTAGLGLNFTSCTEQQKYYAPFNRRKFDVILEEHVKIGAKNSVYTEQNSSNQLIKGYKRFTNRKEYIDDLLGGMDTQYYVIMFAVPSAMDLNTGTIEVTGETIVYYKDN